MRTSAGYDRVANRWAAHNEGDRNKGSAKYSSMSFAESIFYSYVTPVARYHTSADGKKYVLMTNIKWSNTTQRHLRAAHGSVSVPIFEVPNIGAWGGRHHEKPDLDHDANLQHLLVSLETFRKWTAKRWNASEWALEHDDRWPYELRRLWGIASDYCLATGMKHALQPIDEMINAVHVERAARRAAYENPTAVAKRERDKARRLAKEALGID